MNYRYGDSTPFPVDENFADTARAIAKLCVALFQCDLAADERRARADRIRAIAEQELARLDAVRGWVETSVDPLIPKTRRRAMPGSEAAAVEIRRHTRSTVKRARAKVARRRDAAVRYALGTHVGDVVDEQVVPFLLSRQLPRTRWDVRWSAVGAGDARALLDALIPQGLRVRFGTTLHGTLFGAPFRAAEIAGSLTLPIPDSRGRLKTRALATYYVREFESSQDREFFIIQRGRRHRPGFRVMMRGGSDAGPLLIPIDEIGRQIGAEVVLAGDAVDDAAYFWAELQARIPMIVARRSSVLRATLGNRPIGSLERPAALAEALLRAIAPSLREMRMRSPVPGDMILRRITGDGSEKTVRVPIPAIERMYQVLPEEYQQHFRAAGFTSDLSTTTPRRSRQLPIAAHEYDERREPRRLPTERTPTEPFAEIEIDVDENDSTTAA